MIFNLPTLNNALLYVLPLMPVLAWPTCPDICKHCKKEIKGTSFFIFSLRLYCDDCRLLLNQDELEREQEHKKSMRGILSQILKASGMEVADDDVEEVSSKLFLKTLVERKRAQRTW